MGLLRVQSQFIFFLLVQFCSALGTSWSSDDYAELIMKFKKKINEWNHAVNNRPIEGVWPQC